MDLLSISVIIFIPSLIILINFIVAAHNRKINAIETKFIQQIQEMNFICLNDVKLSFWEIMGYQHYSSLNNRCNLYLFDDCIVLFRYSNAIFKINHAPIRIASSNESIDSIFKSFDTYLPTKIIFKHTLKSEVEIKMRKINNENTKFELTLKELLMDQIHSLERIKKW